MLRKAQSKSTSGGWRLITAVAAAGLFLTACSSADDPDTGEATTGTETGGEEYRVMLAVSTLQNPYFITLSEGAEAIAEAEGVTLDILDAQDDPAVQANHLADAVTQEYDLVIINPTDSAAAAPAVQEVLDAGIPVIAVDRAVDGADVTASIASDNVQGGELAAAAMAEAIGESGQVAMLAGIPGADSTIDREEGFVIGLEQFPDIELVTTQTANYDRAEGLTVTENILQANPDIVGIYAQNDEMALGAIQALGALAGTDVFVVGFDGTDDGIAAINDGTMFASIAQQAALLGETAVLTAIDILSGETVEESIAVEVQTLTLENAS